MALTRLSISKYTSADKVDEVDEEEEVSVDGADKVVDEEEEVEEAGSGLGVP